MGAGSIVIIVFVLLMISGPTWFTLRTFNNMSSEDQEEFLRRFDEDKTFSGTLL